MLLVLVCISGCASGGATKSESQETFTPTGSEAVNEPPSPYGADRKEQLEEDINTMWDKDREAGHSESSIAARSAARRVFADMDKTFHGTAADVIAYLGHEPDSRTSEGLVYVIQAPSYVDEYTVLFQNETFRGVRYEHKPRLFRQTGN